MCVSDRERENKGERGACERVRMTERSGFNHQVWSRLHTQTHRQQREREKLGGGSEKERVSVCE